MVRGICLQYGVLPLRFVIAAAFLALSFIASAQLASGGWPKQAGTATNSGLCSYYGATPIIKWTFFFAPVKDSGRSPAVSLNGTVYVAGTNGNIYAFNGTTGDIVWQQPIGEASFSTPSLGANGLVYIGNDAGDVLAFNATTGNPVWSTTPSTTAGQSIGPTAIGPDGTVYVGCLDGNFYALNGGAGAVKWSFNEGVAGVNNAEFSCAAFGSGGTIYVGGASNVYALDGAGGLIWSYSSADNVFTSAALGADGTVYVGGTDKLIIALDGATGLYKWSVPTGGQIISNPSIGSDGTLYFGSDDGNLYAVDGTAGSIKWTTNLGAIESTVAIAGDGTLYVGTMGGTFSAVNSTTGAVVWTYQADGPVFDPAIGPDGSVYVASDGGYLYAFYSGVYISSLTLNPSTVLGGSSSTGTITLSGLAPPGGLVANLVSDSGSAAPPLSVTVPAGQKTATFTVNTSVVLLQQQVKISATYNGISQYANLTIDPIEVTALSVSPGSIQGGSSSVGTATLNEAAPPGGVVVSLSSSSPAAMVAATFTVPAGQSSATFPISSSAVFVSTQATLTALISGGSQATASLTVLPPLLVSISFSPSTVPGGTPSTGTLTISSIAPVGGLIVGLSSNNGVVTFPSTVTVSAGKVAATFKVITNFETQQATTTITATLGSQTVSGQLIIGPSALASLVLNPATVAGGAPSTGTVTLSQPAPTGGSVIVLSSNTLGVSVPSSVTVPAGSTTAKFTAASSLVVAKFVAIISASLAGITQTATLTLNPLALTSVTVAPTNLAGGSTATGTLTLNGPAPAGGFVVALSSSSPAAAVPGSAMIAQGQWSTTFQIPTTSVTAKTVATVSANLNGESPLSATLTIVPAILVSLTFSPPAVAGGSTSVGTLTLSGIAPPGGLQASLTTTSSAVSIPKGVSFAGGQSVVTFKVTTAVVAQQTGAIIVANLGQVSLEAILTLNASSVQSISLSPGSVLGGAPSTGTVTLTSPAPKGGLSVKLSSSLSSATVPASVTVAVGKSTATFSVKTSAVPSQAVAKITATTGTVSQSAGLTLNPPTLVSLSLSPISVKGGSTSTGTITISSPAPVGGLVVSLSCNQASVAAPSSITIQAGHTSATFSVKTTRVSTKTAAILTGTLGGIAKSVTLTIS